MSGTPEDDDTRDEETPVAAASSSSMSEIPLERGEASMPAPEEIRTSARFNNNDENGGGGNRRMKSILCYVALFFILLAVFVGLGVGLVGGDNNGGSSGSSNASEIRKFSFEDVSVYLQEEGITDSAELLPFQMTPQSQAARWLAEEDPRNLALPPTGVNSQQGYHFIARYILTTIYFATSGADWRFRFNFLSEDDICFWRQTLYVVQSGQPMQFGSFCDSSGEINKLYLDGNQLDGTIPSELTKLTTLRELDMNFNDNIGGPLPSDIGNLSLLQRLAFSDNILNGNIPSSICDLTFLELLHLGYNTLVGGIPDCIGSLGNLNFLFLADNVLTGPIPATFEDLTQLELLWLDDNQLSGDLSTTFDKMTSLKAVYAEDNLFQGTIDDNFMANHRGLVQLDLSNNDFLGSVPAHFFDPTRMPLLELFDVHNNRLSGVLPDLPSQNMEMNFLALHRNSIGGPIPESWESFGGLFHLDLSSNELTGPMPDFLGNVTALKYLFLANNTFTPGPIPDLSGLTRMEDFSLKRTNRTGALPEWIAEWEELVLLDLDNNNLIGNIPASWGNLTKLQFLLLNRNNLAGRVPSTFSSLTNLRAVFLERNVLTGQLDVLCNLPGFADITADSPPSAGDDVNVIAADCVGGVGGLDAAIVCECCAICCKPIFGSEDTMEGLGDEVTCHDATEIASLEPIWERIYTRSDYDFGNTTRFFTREDAG